MEQSNNRTREQWNNGTIEQGNNRTVEQWNLNDKPETELDNFFYRKEAFSPLRSCLYIYDFFFFRRRHFL